MPTMRMSISQPSEYMVILTPLDREAKAWYHTLITPEGEAVPKYLIPDVAEVVIVNFQNDGGVLVPN